MNELFLRYLSLSLSGSLVMLALILLRPIHYKFGNTWRYYIWLPVLFRLLVPVVPTAGIVGSLFQEAENRLAAQHPAAVDFWEEEETGGLQNLPASEQQNVIAQRPDPGGFDFSSLKRQFPGILWLSAAIFLIFRKIYGYWHFMAAVRKGSRMIREGALCDTLNAVCTQLHIGKRIAVGINPLIRAPMLIGMGKPAVILPADSVSRTELVHIYRHELTHCRRLDFLYKWTVEAAVCLHWFNPLVYWMRRQIGRDCELSCDEIVISHYNEADRQSYGDMLLTCLKTNMPAQRSSVPLALSGNGKLMKERLDEIMRYRKKSKFTVLGAAVLTVILLCGTVYTGAYAGTITESAQEDGKMQKAGGKDQAGIQTAGQTVENDGISSAKDIGTVVYENVEIRQYEEGGHSYIHDRKTNHTEMEIAGFQRGMLAFDKDGRPLKIDWFSLDTESDGAYFYVYEEDSGKIDPGQTLDVHGGWSLNLMGKDSAADNIAYVLYCDKEITFRDGSVWENPDFEGWRTAYEGKITDVGVLQSYYPYEHNITGKSVSVR